MSNSDKLNTLVASNVAFTPGERLSAEKLNYLIEVLEKNIDHLGTAIGDIYDENVSTDLKERSEWGKRFDSNIKSTDAVKRRFDIANIARLIGPASNLNPQAFIDGSNIQISETIPAGVTEYCFKYIRDITYPISIPGFTNTYGKNLLQAGNFYYIENNTIYFAEPTSQNINFTYYTSPTEYNGGPNYQGASFNVYPDPNQNVGKLDITYQEDTATGTVSYTVSLPAIANQQGSFGDSFETTSLDNTDINLNQQLKWPEWIRDLDNSPDPNTIPPYSLYLKNYTLNESYLDATYTKVSDTEIRINNLQIGNQDCIDNYDLRIVTVGTDITTSIDDLRNKMFLHKHDGSFGEPKINIKNIAGFYETEAPRSGPYYPSSANWNPLSGYLHRDGYYNSDPVNGDNAMRGPLMMGLTSFNPISSRNIVSPGTEQSGTSQSIQFGNNYKLIYGSNDVLVIDNIIGKLLLNQNLQIHTHNYNDSDYVNPFSTVGSLIENVNAFEKINLDLCQANFETTLSIFEGLAGDLNDDNVSGGGKVANNYILKVDQTNSSYWLDWKQLRTINGNIKYIFTNEGSGTLDNIDYFTWKTLQGNDSFYLEVESNYANPFYYIDLTGTFIVKNGKQYYFNPLYTINPNNFTLQTNPATIVINRFRNYYSVLDPNRSNQDLDCLIKTKYSIYIKRSPYSDNSQPAFYLIFNYNGKIENGNYISSIEEPSDIIYVESQHIRIMDEYTYDINLAVAGDSVENGHSETKFRYIYYVAGAPPNIGDYNIQLNVEEIYNPRLKSMEIIVRATHIGRYNNFNIHD